MFGLGIELESDPGLFLISTINKILNGVDGLVRFSQIKSSIFMLIRLSLPIYTGQKQEIGSPRLVVTFILLLHHC